MKLLTSNGSGGRAMYRVTRSVFVYSAVIVACLVLADSTEADFRRDYSSGLRDYDSGKYASAIKDLEKAIKQESSARDNVRFYGMSFAPYIPYFFLGQSLFKEGDCDGALTAWRKSIEQGVVSSQEEFAELQKNQAECESKSNKPPVALVKAVEDYFNGKFPEAAGVDPSVFKEVRAQVQALLFRAASNYNLWLLSGETDKQLRKLYQGDIRSIKNLNPGFSPYDGGFSPQFIKLFNETG